MAFYIISYLILGAMILGILRSDFADDRRLKGTLISDVFISLIWPYALLAGAFAILIDKIDSR